MRAGDYLGEMRSLRYRQFLVATSASTLAGAVIALVGAASVNAVVTVLGLLLVVGTAIGVGLAIITVLHRQMPNLEHLAWLREAVQRIARRLGEQPGSLEARLRHHMLRDSAALLTLHDLYPTPGEHVPLTSYSALPATALLLTELVREAPKGALIVELGGGATTVWMALAAQRRGGDVSIVSLDHSAELHRCHASRAAAKWRRRPRRPARRGDGADPDQPRRPGVVSQPRRGRICATSPLLFVDGPPKHRAVGSIPRSSSTSVHGSHRAGWS